MRKNPRSYRHLVKDMVIVLKAPLHPETKITFIHSLLWGWSEKNGKYAGLRCSMAALKHYRSKGIKDLRHDHAVPRNLIVKMLLNLKGRITPGRVRKILKKYCGAVIITKKDDIKLNKMGLRQKMPGDWNGRELLARYKAASIRISKRVLGC